MEGHLADLCFIYFLSTYCFACPILFGQVNLVEGPHHLGSNGGNLETAKSDYPSQQKYWMVICDSVTDIETDKSLHFLALVINHFNQFNHG